MRHLLLSDIEQMSSRYRASFINSLSGFKSLNLVGSISKDGQYNLAPFNSIVHIGSNPPYLGMIARPATESHQTLSNIIASGYYTLNSVSESIMEQAHQCSAKYDANTSEFEQTRLEVFLSEKNIAPYVLASAIKIGLELVEIMPIKLNQTSLVIGKIIEIILPESVISEDGFVDIASAGSITCNGLDSYYSVKALKRIPYAKP